MNFDFLFFYLETSSSNSDEEQSSESQIDDEENILIENEDTDEDDNFETLVFDDSKEIYYKHKYNQTFEESVSLDDVYILNLDAQIL